MLHPGCGQADIVFLVEHLQGDTQDDVNHEALFIKKIARGWDIDGGDVRVGVLAYDKEVKEVR